MSAAEDTVKPAEIVREKAPVIDRIVDFLSSVRFGVVLLCILVVLSMIGMLIIQQNVQGFDAYYASLTPAEKQVYAALKFFDIYHSWYFNVLLLVLSLNIVLASIDRFPVSVWKPFYQNPKLTASKKWLLGQKQNAVVKVAADSAEAAAEKVRAAFESAGLKSQIIQERGKTGVFGERGKINRWGAYIVHVFLLTLFIGHFVANTTGFDADVRMMPGQSTDQIELIEYNLDKKEKFAVQLPFLLDCTDISQKLIDMKGSIETNNTMDWATMLRINDPEYGITEATVSLNNPFNYRGYRFFQAQTVPVGSARNIRLDLIPEKGGDAIPLNIARNGGADLPDGTRVDFEAFMPDFTFNQNGQPDTKSGEYNNPAAILSVTKPGGERERIFAFANKLPDNAPINAPKAGYRWRLTEFEKAPMAHVLSIKYDPYNAAFIAWYIGGFGLMGALMFVFFISHKRVWAAIERNEWNGYDVTLGGNTNRNQFGFEDKFEKIVAELGGEKRLEKED